MSVEVNRPDRIARRRNGKSDPLDAEGAARTQAINAIRALLVTALVELREQLRSLMGATGSAFGSDSGSVAAGG